MQVQRSGTQHGATNLYALHSRRAPAFRYARTVRRAKGSGGFFRRLRCACLRLCIFRPFGAFLS
ncbi:MAG: hypothetical protein LBU42_00350 [Prevotellaceae bacterium]|nr:hypothetical protein [Prevotellaceae bacterium]